MLLILNDLHDEDIQTNVIVCTQTNRWKTVLKIADFNWKAEATECDYSTKYISNEEMKPRA